MARPYYGHNNRAQPKRSAVKTVKKIISALLVRIWRDDMFCITFFKSLFFYKGLWPVDDHPTRRGYWFRYCNPRLAFTTSSFLLVVSMPITTYEARNDELIAFLEPIAFSFLNVMLCVQLFCFTKNSADFRRTLLSLQTARDYGAVSPQPPRAITRRSRNLSMLVLFYSGGCMFCAALFGFGLAVFLYTIRRHFTKLWYPYDGFATPYFEITLLGWACLIFTGGFVIGLVNSFFMALMVQAIRQLEILKYNLLQMRPTFRCRRNKHQQRPHHFVTSHFVVDRKKCDGHFEMELAFRNCAKHHQAIVSFVETVNRVYWPIIVIQYVCSVVPTFIAIVLVIHSKLDMLILFFIALIILCNVSLAAFSFLANELTNQSLLVKDAVFGCEWLSASDGFKRNMRMMILMSNKPLVMKVAGNFNMSLETFLAVMKLTYSYYMAAMTTVKKTAISEQFLYLSMPDVI